MVEKYFPQYAISGQDILGNSKTVEKVLALVPDDILHKLFEICFCKKKVVGIH